MAFSPTERGFFDIMDRELIKVESFYHEGEKEFVTQSAALKEQLHDLHAHRQQLFHVRIN